jgi:hypothetical protein
MITPSNLIPRSAETNSNKCVTCETDIVCPECPSGQECIQTTPTCLSCSKTYCRASTTTLGSSSGKNIGGIVGGTICGVVVLVSALCAFYFLYYKRKVVFNRVRHKPLIFDDDVEINFHRSPQEMEKPSRRTSLSTSVFTRASNIIPIAYIPGVTIAKNSRESTVTVDSELIGDRLSKASIVGNPSLTTTAIRATPKLVSIDGKRNSTVIYGTDNIPATAVNAKQLGGVKSVRLTKNHGFEPQDLIEEEEEGDVQSVVMKDEGTVLSDYDPFIIDDDQTSIRSKDSRGSVLLDVEIDRKNPFED